MSVPASQMQDDGHKAAHGALQAAAGAVSKLAGAQGQPDPHLVELLSGIHGKLDQQTQMMQQGQGGDQGDATDQAVWSRFPSTDPNALEQMLQQTGPEGFLEAFLQQAAQDEDAFHQMQMAQVHAIIGHLSQPQGEPMAGGQAPPPDVTGGSGGYG